MDFSKVETKDVLILDGKIRIVNMICMIVLIILCATVVFRYFSLYYEYSPNVYPENEGRFYNELNLDFWIMSAMGTSFIYSAVITPWVWRLLKRLHWNRFLIVFAYVPVFNVFFIRGLKGGVERYLKEH